MKNNIQITLIIILVSFLVLPSCSMLRQPSQHATVFQSYANSQADIQLDLRKNHRFRYAMTIYPEPGVEESAPTESFQFTGKWKMENEEYIILFRRRNKPDLYALFSQVSDMEANVKVRNEHTISFAMDEEEIIVWGIRCFRQEK